MAVSAELVKLQKTCKPGDVLFSEEDLSRDLYVLMSGKLEVIQKGVTLAFIDKPGSFTGEMALLTGQPRSATIRVAEQATLLKVPPDQLPVLMKGMPDLAMRLAKNLAATVSNLNRELLKAWEAQEFHKALKAEMEKNAQGTLETVIPKISNDVRQRQHDRRIEVAKAYLHSGVFSDPFMQASAQVLSVFYTEPVQVTVDEKLDHAAFSRIVGIDFAGALAGTFVFMAKDEELKTIGLKLFGAKSGDTPENDVLLELASRIITKVKDTVPGLHLELERPEVMEGLHDDGSSIGLKLATSVGFASWVHLHG